MLNILTVTGVRAETETPAKKNMYRVSYGDEEAFQMEAESSLRA